MTRPQNCQVSLYAELTRSAESLRRCSTWYGFHTRAHMIRTADQLTAAAHRLIHRPGTFDEAAAILEASQKLLTLTDD